MRRFFLEKLEKVGNPKKIYIIPTLDGMKLLALNLILLIIGLAYANNYVLLFNFILFGLFLCSMFYAHFNLEGIQIEAVKLSPTHAGETNTIQLFFKSTSKLDHNFININLKSQLIALETNTFSLKKKTNEPSKAEFKVKALKRGVESIHHIYLETLFPFHLFRSFSFHPCHLEVTVYPEINSSKLYLEQKSPGDKDHDNEELSLRPFQHGDLFTRVDWKRLAQTNQWVTKIFTAPPALPITLSFHDVNKENLEAQLSSIATSIRLYHAQGIPYGLKLFHSTSKVESVIPNHSLFHLQHCLKLLAMYEH